MVEFGAGRLRQHPKVLGLKLNASGRKQDGAYAMVQLGGKISSVKFKGH